MLSKHKKNVRRLNLLKKYKAKHGDCNVPSYFKANRLGSWVTSIRTRKRMGQLSPSLIQALDSLGFVWEWQALRAEGTWMGMFRKLKRFKQRFGHCNVGVGWAEDRKLGRWVSAQRGLRKTGEVSEAHVRRLDELGFVWNHQACKGQETWKKWYRELEAYARQHGHTRVPRNYENTKLASWVWIQRGRRRNPSGKARILTDEQIALLDKLGFRWQVHKETWAARLEQLKRFKEAHGHCDVRDDPGLRVWVQQQRLMKARGSLSAGRKAQLDALGFAWDGILHLEWQKMYGFLKAFHAEHGHADVHFQYLENMKLARWVSTQRARRKYVEMPRYQIRLLNALGFTWKFKRPYSGKARHG